MTKPETPADRIYRQLETVMLLSHMTAEQQVLASEARQKRIAAVLGTITPEALRSAVEAWDLSADEPFGVLHYRLAASCYNTVLIDHEDFTRIQNRRHDAEQRLDEIGRLMQAMQRDGRPIPDWIENLFAHRRDELLED